MSLTDVRREVCALSCKMWAVMDAKPKTLMTLDVKGSGAGVFAITRKEPAVIEHSPNPALQVLIHDSSFHRGLVHSRL